MKYVFEIMVIFISLLFTFSRRIPKKFVTADDIERDREIILDLLENDFNVKEMENAVHIIPITKIKNVLIYIMNYGEDEEDIAKWFNFYLNSIGFEESNLSNKDNKIFFYKKILERILKNPGNLIVIDDKLSKDIIQRDESLNIKLLYLLEEPTMLKFLKAFFKLGAWSIKEKENIKKYLYEKIYLPFHESIYSDKKYAKLINIESQIEDIRRNFIGFFKKWAKIYKQRPKLDKEKV